MGGKVKESSLIKIKMEQKSKLFQFIKYFFQKDGQAESY